MGTDEVEDRSTLKKGVESEKELEGTPEQQLRSEYQVTELNPNGSNSTSTRNRSQQRERNSS